MKNGKILYSTILVLLIKTASVMPAGWTIQPSPSQQNLYAVSSSGVNTWAVVGDGGTILRSTDSGLSWESVSSPVTDGLRGVCLHNNLGLAVGISGRIIRTTDSGLSWTEIPRPTTRNLYSVSMSDVMAVAVGHEGTILVSSDNGLTWVLHTAGTASALFGVSVNGSFAVGVGSAGAVVMTVNGGSGWGLTVIGGQTTFFYGTSFENNLTGWLVGSASPGGNVIARSSNAGFSWMAQNPPVSSQLFGVSFTSADTGTAVGSTGTIIHTVNGGADWVNQESPTVNILHGVSFANNGLGVAVGDFGTILQTTNGGVTGVSHENNSNPSGFSLSQNYPNPFNPETSIRFSLNMPVQVSLVIYNSEGREIEQLINGFREAGSYSVKWDAAKYSSGSYFYRLETPGFSDTKKMVLVK